MNSPVSDLRIFLDKMQGKKVVVIGDIMLDRYVEGDVSRISPEAPVPVVRISSERCELGGAANVAANIVSLGGEAVLVGFVGEDEAGRELKEILTKKGIKLIYQEVNSTIQKTRVIGKSQQLVRLDVEEAYSIKFETEVKRKIFEEAREADVIIISDYAKGVVDIELMDYLAAFRSKIIVDPKPQNKYLYRGVKLITPNEKESFEMSGKTDYLEAGFLLREQIGSNVLITRGEKGVALFSEEDVEIPTFAREVFDVTGAGDSVIAAIALAIGAGASLKEASILGNYSGGCAVEHRGTYSVTLSDIRNKLSDRKKIILESELFHFVESARRNGKRIVWTSGCFDLIHVGHIRCLQEAKRQGDLLIVGLNNDESVKINKGEMRPIQSQNDRAEILEALEPVDKIIIFSEERPVRILREIRPDVYVKGGDYKLENLNSEERQIVEECGGRIYLVPLQPLLSTSSLIKKAGNLAISSRYCSEQNN